MKESRPGDTPARILIRICYFKTTLQGSIGIGDRTEKQSTRMFKIIFNTVSYLVQLTTAVLTI